MKDSRRARRMKEHYKRSKDRTATLNMVSLMDIFTILVFFLLVNATSSEVLPTPKKIVLPNASVEQQPRRNLVIAVSSDNIQLEGSTITDVASVNADKASTIRALYLALQEKRDSVRDLTDTTGVTIMADREVPYALLKKIMLTARGAEFNRISFAVNQRSGEGQS